MSLPGQTLGAMKAEISETLMRLKRMFIQSSQIRGTVILRDPKDPGMTVMVTDDPDPEAAVRIGMNPP